MIRKAAGAALCAGLLWLVWELGWIAGDALAMILLGPPRVLGMPV